MIDNNDPYIVMTSPSVCVADNSCGAVVPACGLQRVDNRGLKLAPPPSNHHHQNRSLHIRSHSARICTILSCYCFTFAVSGLLNPAVGFAASIYLSDRLLTSNCTYIGENLTSDHYFIC